MYGAQDVKTVVEREIVCRLQVVSDEIRFRTKSFFRDDQRRHYDRAVAGKKTKSIRVAITALFTHTITVRSSRGALAIFFIVFAQREEAPRTNVETTRLPYNELVKRLFRRHGLP